MKITDYLAVYAAILSTLVFAWNVFQSRPRIKVDLAFALECIDGAPRSGIYIVVRNLSPHDVHLSDISIVYPYMTPSLRQRFAHAWKYKVIPRRLGWSHSSLQNYGIESGCPVCVQARKSHKVFISDLVVDTMLEEASERALIACVQDQLWNNVYSRKFSVPSPKAA